MKVLVEFNLPDDCEPSIVDRFITTNNYEIVMSVNGIPTDYALELIEKALFPIDIVREVWDGSMVESDTSVSLHPSCFDDAVIGALMKNPNIKLTASTEGHYYFAK